MALGRDKVIAEVDGGSGYDWDYFALLRDDDGRLYTYKDSGCSCNSAWDGDETFEPVESTASAIHRARNYLYTDADKEAFTKSAMEVK